MKKKKKKPKNNQEIMPCLEDMLGKSLQHINVLLNSKCGKSQMLSEYENFLELTHYSNIQQKKTKI